MSEPINKAEQAMQEKAEAEARRAKIRNEILETERSYNRDINRFNDEFLKPLKEKLKTDKSLQKNKKIQEFIKMADKILPLINLSNQMLSELEESVKNGNLNNNTVVTMFNKFMPFFKMTAEYVANYNDLLELWGEIEKENEIQLLSKEFAQKSKQLGVESHLILPIQRGPRYEMLLRDLVKHTSDTDESYPPLTETLETTKKVMIHINEFDREFARHAELRKSLEKTAYSSLENKKLRSVEFSKNKSEAFFKLSSIDDAKLQQSLSRKFGFNAIVSKSDFLKKECSVTIVRKDNNTGKETPYKFKILKGTADGHLKGKEKANTFHVRIEHHLNTLSQKEQDILYALAQEIGGSVINSIEKAPKAENFKVHDPIRSHKFEEFKQDHLTEKKKPSLIFSGEKKPQKPSAIDASLEQKKKVQHKHS